MGREVHGYAVSTDFSSRERVVVTSQDAMDCCQLLNLATKVSSR